MKMKKLGNELILIQALLAMSFACEILPMKKDSSCYAPLWKKLDIHNIKNRLLYIHNTKLDSDTEIHTASMMPDSKKFNRGQATELYLIPKDHVFNPLENQEWYYQLAAQGHLDTPAVWDQIKHHFFQPGIVPDNVSTDKLQVLEILSQLSEVRPICISINSIHEHRGKPSVLPDMRSLIHRGVSVCRGKNDDERVFIKSLLTDLEIAERNLPADQPWTPLVTPMLETSCFYKPTLFLGMARKIQKRVIQRVREKIDQSRKEVLTTFFCSSKNTIKIPQDLKKELFKCCVLPTFNEETAKADCEELAVEVQKRVSSIKWFNEKKGYEQRNFYLSYFDGLDKSNLTAYIKDCYLQKMKILSDAWVRRIVSPCKQPSEDVTEQQEDVTEQQEDRIKEFISIPQLRKHKAIPAI